MQFTRSRIYPLRIFLIVGIICADSVWVDVNLIVGRDAASAIAHVVAS